MKFILSFGNEIYLMYFEMKRFEIHLCEIYHILLFILQFNRNDYICKMDGKIRIYYTI